MAIGIHFDDDDVIDYDDTMGIGIGHREEKEEEPDGETMGIGIGHPKEEKTEENK